MGVWQVEAVRGAVMLWVHGSCGLWRGPGFDRSLGPAAEIGGQC